LSIQHSKSKENAPYTTDRSVIRLDASRADENGKIVTVSVYNVVANPNGGPHDADLVQRMFAGLSLFMTFGSCINDTFTVDAATGNLTDRVIFGEP
jgi:hypothetical protein